MRKLLPYLNMISIIALGILFLANFRSISRLEEAQENISLNLLNYKNETFNKIETLSIELENKVEEKYRKLEKEINRINGIISRRTVVSPTLQELKDFIREDNIDELPYISENYEFVCSDYANKFIKSFAEKGYFSCHVLLYFTNDRAHSLVAVNTSDYGLVFVEPQTDTIIYSLREGEDYCKKVNWDCNLTILKIKTCFD